MNQQFDSIFFGQFSQAFVKTLFEASEARIQSIPELSIDF